ncbi:MAG: hypothetical protein AAFV51_09840 [Pseudomonadota bacterium]
MRAFLLAIALAGAGCVGDDILELQAEAEWPLGYSDGCATAEERSRKFSTRVVRDDDLFESNRAYAAAWRQGYQACGRLNSDVVDSGGLDGEVGDP